MAPPLKVVVDQGSASARSSGNSNNNSVSGATGAVPKQQQQQQRPLLNGGTSAAGTAATTPTTGRSTRSRRQQEHLGEPDLEFVEPLQRETLKTLNVSCPLPWHLQDTFVDASPIYKYTSHSSRPRDFNPMVQ